MQTHTRILLVLSLILVATFAAIPAHAQQPPLLPQAFYGTVEVNGQPAPIGTRIEARGEGVKTGIEGNPLVVTVAGRYGGRTISDPKLIVQGDVQEETLITFYVNGVPAECSVPDGTWQTSYPFSSGGLTELNLKVRIYNIYLPTIMR
jgi:hypothetical protein